MSDYQEVKYDAAKIWIDEGYYSYAEIEAIKASFDAKLAKEEKLLAASMKRRES